MKLANFKSFFLNLEGAITHIRNGANAVCTFFKTVLLQCDTVPDKIIHISPSLKEARITVGCENGISNQDSFLYTPENKTSATLLTGFDRASLVDDVLRPKNINAEVSTQTDSIDDASVNK